MDFLLTEDQRRFREDARTRLSAFVRRKPGKGIGPEAFIESIETAAGRNFSPADRALLAEEVGRVIPGAAIGIDLAAAIPAGPLTALAAAVGLMETLFDSLAAAAPAAVAGPLSSAVADLSAAKMYLYRRTVLSAERVREHVSGGSDREAALEHAHAAGAALGAALRAAKARGRRLAPAFEILTRLLAEAGRVPGATRP